MTATHPAVDLRIDLEVAARAALQYGATDEQIRTIVALARGSNEYNLGVGGHLTKAQANHIIDRLIEDGAEPEFRKSPEEIALEQESAASAAKNAAAKKIARSQDKEAKAGRDGAEAIKGAEMVGQRVHNKYQKICGTVVSQGGNRVPVQFDGEAAARTVAVAFVTLGEL